MAETVTALSEPLCAALRKEKLVILHVVDAETGYPGINAISWVYAVDERTIRFAVDQRSRLINSLKQNPKCSVTLFGEGTVHAVFGEAAQRAETLEGVPFKLSCFDIGITAVRDAMFYGARVSVEPEYEKTYDKRAAAKLDGQVFDAMQGLVL